MYSEIENSDIHVLIVDDLADNRMLLRLDLEDELPGINVDEAASGAEALKKIGNTDFSLVLCDLMMPEIDGFEVYRQVRNQGQNVDIPFIFISANQDQAVHDQGLELGAIDFLTKPYDVPELVHKVRNLARMKHLYNKQAELLKTIEVANKELKASNQQKDEVLRIVSHDMRNPLNNIIGLGQVLYDEPEQTTEDVKAMAEVITRSGENLLDIVNTLLDAARIEAGKVEMQFRETDLCALLNTEIEQYRYSTQQKAITLIDDFECENISAEVDAPKIKQVIDNLLSNALKFTPENGTISVKVYHNNGNVVMEVADTGIGIPPEKVQFVFEKFSPAQRLGTNREKGTGLGLSIARKFIELHDGTISVESELDEGTRFIITIPKKHS